jgi:hypothetical protein
MTLRRSSRPAVDTAAVRAVADLYVTYLEARDTCARLVDLRLTGTPVQAVREEALSVARRVATMARLTFDAILEASLLERLPADLDPSGVFPALARMGYALVALAEEGPEPEALLTATELQDLGSQYRIDGWLARCAELSGEAGAS